MAKISAVVITKNEESNIGKCIYSLKKVCSEIIIADSQSTDRTYEIASQKGAMVIDMEWKGYSVSKNEANRLAQYDWILSLDADEYLDDKLKNNIAQIKLSDDHKLYEFRRRNYINKKLVRFGTFNPDYKIRLWNRNIAKWDGEVHEDLVFDKNSTKVERLTGSIIHNTFDSFEEHWEKEKKYAEIAANASIRSHDLSSLDIFLKSIYRFFNAYFIKMGILDGITGFKLARIAMRAGKYKYTLLKKKNK